MDPIYDTRFHTLRRPQLTTQPSLPILLLPTLLFFRPQQPRDQQFDPPQTSFRSFSLRIRATNRLHTMIHRPQPRRQPHPLRRRLRQRRIQHQNLGPAVIGWEEELFVLCLVMCGAPWGVEFPGTEGGGDADDGESGWVDGGKGFAGGEDVALSIGVALLEEGVHSVECENLVCQHLRTEIQSCPNHPGL